MLGNWGGRVVSEGVTIGNFTKVISEHILWWVGGQKIAKSAKCNL